MTRITLAKHARKGPAPPAPNRRAPLDGAAVRAALARIEAALILKAAVDWAPYEHATLAPLVVDLPQEAEEDRARRLHAALLQMRETVGDRRQ